MALYRVCRVFSIDIEIEEDAEVQEAREMADAVPIYEWDMVDEDIELLP